MNLDCWSRPVTGSTRPSDGHAYPPGMSRISTPHRSERGALGQRSQLDVTQAHPQRGELGQLLDVDRVSIRLVHDAELDVGVQPDRGPPGSTVEDGREGDVERLLGLADDLPEGGNP